MSMIKHATMSNRKRYRYQLEHSWSVRNSTIVFTGLNPSTADSTDVDPTIRKCIAYAQA